MGRYAQLAKRIWCRLHHTGTSCNFHIILSLQLLLQHVSFQKQVYFDFKVKDITFQLQIKINTGPSNFPKKYQYLNMDFMALFVT